MVSLSLLVLRTPDLEKTMTFYQALLGKTFVPEKHGRGPGHYSVTLDHDLVFEIYPGAVSPGCLGFRIHSIAQTLKNIKHLLAKEPDLKWGSDVVVGALIEDPDGRRINLMT